MKIRAFRLAAAAACISVALTGCADDTTSASGGPDGGSVGDVGGVSDPDGLGGADSALDVAGDDSATPQKDTAITPDGGAPGEDVVAPDIAQPDATVPDAAIPDAVIPDATSPDADVTDDPEISVPDAEEDLSEPDTSEPDITEPDITEPDAGPDVISGECVAGEQCPVPVTGLPDVSILAVAGLPPAAPGGAIPAGDYELSLAEIYLDTLGGGSPLPIEITVKSNGNTYGSAKFDGFAWAIEANLDLFMSIPLLGQSFQMEQEIGGGGCFSVVGHTLEGDLLECYQGTPPDIALPTEFPYDNGGNTLRLQVTVAKEVLLDAIPAEYQSTAKLFIKGDLAIVLELTAM